MTKTTIKKIFTAIQLVAVVLMYSLPGLVNGQTILANASDDRYEIKVGETITKDVFVNDSPQGLIYFAGYTNVNDPSLVEIVDAPSTNTQDGSFTFKGLKPGTYTFDYYIYCNTANGRSNSDATVTIVVTEDNQGGGQCEIDLDANPSTVQEGKDVELTWNTTGDTANNARVTLSYVIDAGSTPTGGIIGTNYNLSGSTTVTAPQVSSDVDVDYKATVVCEDGSDRDSQDTVRVTNDASAPVVANASDDRYEIKVGETITKDVFVNDSPQGLIYFAGYTNVNDPSLVEIVDAPSTNTQDGSFTFKGLKPGTYTFDYYIYCNTANGRSNSDATVTIVVTEDNQGGGQCEIDLEVNNADANFNTTEGDTVLLDWATTGSINTGSKVSIIETLNEGGVETSRTIGTDYAPSDSLTLTAPNVDEDSMLIYKAQILCTDSSLAIDLVSGEVKNIELNAPPVAVDDEYTFDVNEVRDLNVMVNDYDQNRDDIDLVRVYNVNNGIATIINNEDGVVRYTAPSTPGVYYFNYEITDGEFNRDATVKITVNQPSACSIQVKDDEYEINVGQTLTKNVLNNDTIPGTAKFGDSNPDGNHAVSFDDNEGPEYTFTGKNAGSYIFQYQVACEDGRNPQDAVVNIVVKSSGGGGGSCPAVSARNDVVSNVSAGSMKLIDVLNNDSTGSKGEPLTIDKIVSGPSNGKAIIVSGKIQYQSDSDFKGTDTVVYRVENDCGKADEATVTITVGKDDNGGGGSVMKKYKREKKVKGIEDVNLDIFNERLTKITDSKYVLTWNTNIPATSQVVYGMRSVARPNGQCGSDLGYQQKTDINSNRTTTHIMVVDGLTPGAQYFFRPVSDRSDTDCERGRELTHRPVNVCEGYIRDFMRIGQYNDPREVAKLQAFLRIFEGLDVRITGTFDVQTDRAVKDFQLRYYEEVLAPWGYDRDEATGYVYITTRNKINEIICDRDIPFTSSQLREIANFRSFWNNRFDGHTPVSTQPIDRDNTKSAGYEALLPTDDHDDLVVEINDGDLTDSDTVIIGGTDTDNDNTITDDEFFLDTVIDGNQEKSAERELGEKSAGAAVLSGILSFIFSLPFLLTVLGILVLLLIYEVLKDRKNKNKREEEVVVVETVPTPNQ